MYTSLLPSVPHRLHNSVLILPIVTTHQANAARLASLQTLTTQLSEQITSTVTLLSTTRASLLSTPSAPSTFSAPSSDPNEPPFPINAKELLQYAHRISKFTVPPSRRAPDAAVTPAVPEEAPPINTSVSATPADANANVNVNVNGDGEGEGKENGTTAEATGAQTPATGGRAVTALEQHESQWVNPEKSHWFVPWPSDDLIRRGGLASLQAGIPAPKERKGENKDREDAVAEEDVKIRGVDGREAMAGVHAMGATVAEENKPAVFTGLDLYDPDDD